jgi:hypothetical protein
MEKQYKAIKKILEELNTSDAINLIEEIGTELRRNNSVRISKQLPKKLINLERPDLITLKRKK